MSEEQIKESKQGCCKGVACAAIVALILSIASLTLSILNMNGVALAGGPAAAKQQKPVVISKQYDKGRTLEKALATNKPVIVFFYTDWCGFCQKFAPVFDKVTKKPAMKQTFAVAFVNCEKEENQKIMQEYDVQGFPTVYVINKDKKTQLDNNTFFNEDSVDVVSNNALELVANDAE